MTQFASAKNGMTSIGFAWPGGDPWQRDDHVRALDGFAVDVVKCGVEPERVALRERNAHVAGKRDARRLLPHRHQPLDHRIEELAPAVVRDADVVHHTVWQGGSPFGIPIAQLNTVAAHPSAHRPRHAQHRRVHHHHVVGLVGHSRDAERAG